MLDIDRLEENLSNHWDGAHVESWNSSTQIAESINLDSSSELGSAIASLRDLAAKDAHNLDWTVRFWRGDDVFVYPFSLRFDDGGGVIELSDGSAKELGQHIIHVVNETVQVADSIGHSVDGGRGGALDHGRALLDPITLIERQTVDEMITLIGRLAAEEQLDELQEAQLEVIVTILRDAHDAAEPGVTPRNETVARVTTAYRALARYLPGFAFGLLNSKVYDLLRGIDWFATAEVVRGWIDRVPKTL